MFDADATAVEAIASLAHNVEQDRAIEVGTEDVIARVVPNNEAIEVMDLETQRPAPRRARGHAILTDPAGFVDYVNRLSDTHTTVWADERLGGFTVVFNDHANAGAAGWRDHTASLELAQDPDWAAWIRCDGRLSDQVIFAEFIQAHTGEITSPDAATMLEIATSFKASRSARFEKGTSLQSGDVQLRWTEETTAKAGRSSQVEVPETFTVRLAPFIGVEAVELTARLRWRIRDGELGIGYQLHRPDIAVREAFDKIRAFVADNITPPVYLGTKPDALTPKPLLLASKPRRGEF